MAYKSKYTGKQVDDGLDLAYEAEQKIQDAVHPLEESLNQEAQSRQSEDKNIRGSIETVSKRVTNAEGQIAGLQGDVDELQTEVSKVKNDVVPKAVADGIASVVANAPTDLDTLKEIADYIASDKTNAAEINNAISALQQKDSELLIDTRVNYGEIQQLKHDANGTLGMVLDNSRAIQQHTKDIAKNAEDIANHSQAIDKAAKDVVSNTQAINLLAEAVETKAPKVGYAPDLKVDFAKELVGRGVAAPQEIGTIRPTGVISIGDGNATIEKVKGRSVVWNQYDKSFNYSSGYLTITSTEDGIYTLNGQAKNTGIIYGMLLGCKSMLPENKGLEIIEIISGEFEEGEAGTKGIEHLGSHYSFSRRGVFVKIGKNDYAYLKIAFQKGDKFTNLKFRANLYDLTLMFGAGNEPTTFEEFEARKPLNVSNEYNDGEIVSYDAQELKSVGFNAFNGTYAKVIGGQKYHAYGAITSIGFTTELGGETTEVTLDSDGLFTPTEDGYVYAEGKDIVIHLTHSYTPEHVNEYQEDTLPLPDVKAIKDKDGNQLFPHGLLSAGSVHDEITATKAVKRVGVVDLGTLAWYINKQGPRFVAAIVKMKSVGSWNQIGFLNATKYNVGEVGGPNFEGNIGTFINHIYVQDNSYTDSKTFKASLSGVLFYYELAEPIEVDLPEPLNMTYEAWDFGTEELVAEGKTTPLNADIVYQFNAVDRIRENTAKNQALEAELAELKAQLTQLTQVTNDENSNA